MMVQSVNSSLEENITIGHYSILMSSGQLCECKLFILLEIKSNYKEPILVWRYEEKLARKNVCSRQNFLNETIDLSFYDRLLQPFFTNTFPVSSRIKVLVNNKVLLRQNKISTLLAINTLTCIARDMFQAIVF